MHACRSTLEDPTILDQGASQTPPRTQSFGSFSDKYSNWQHEQLELDAIATTVVARSHAATRMTEQELREHPDWDIVSSMRIPPVRGGMLASPLVGRGSGGGSNLGVLYLCDRYEGTFTPDDEAILTQLAQMTSIAIENALFAEERETNRIKDEFLSTLSHELRTPLNAILGWTQLMRAGPMNEETAHAMEVIERNARAQAKLVEDLLDVSRVTTGKLRLNKRVVKLSETVAIAVDAVRPLAEEKGLTLSCQAQTEGDDAVTGDADRLQQVVWNLLNNAVKFTPAGGRVEVLVQRLGESIRVRVSDTGRGISPQFLPHVFDRFRQADASSTRSHGGLGIGLTIVRHIVELHGGSVHAESGGEGQGASFFVTIPIAARAGAMATTNPSSSKSPGALAADAKNAVDLSGLSIIVVDDEPDARDVIARVLARAGATATPCASVREALAALGRQRPDVIVSDIAMPNEDGFDLIRIVRELPAVNGRTAPIPALALTAYAREEDRARCLSSGFGAHLAKPVDPAELLGVVAHLAHAGAPNAPVEPPAQLRCG